MDYNTFDDPTKVQEAKFEDFSFDGKVIKVNMKPCSCVTLRVTL